MKARTIKTKLYHIIIMIIAIIASELKITLKLITIKTFKS